MSHHPALPSIYFTLQSGALTAREATAQLMGGLAPLDLDIEESGTVELVVAEAINNIVEHGYPDPNNGGPVSLLCAHGMNGLHIRLVDTGLPMPKGETPIGLAADTDVDFMDMPEGGFGWFIIKDLAKDVTYKRIDGANQLDLRIAVALGSKN